MKIICLGGGFISDHLPYQKVGDPYIIDYNDVDNIIETHKPDVIVNCIGKTGRPNIDWCESNKAITALSNTLIPIMLADRCEVYGIHFINIGSGCIYFGESRNLYSVQGDGSPMPKIKTYSLGDPNYELWWSKLVTLTLPTKLIDDGWKETDFANPKSYYSKTKYACDLAIGNMSHVTTLRIRMPVSDKNTSRNFINKVRNYKQVIDIPNSMTFMKDFVRCVEWTIKGQHMGIYHVTNPQPLTAARIMREFQKYVPEHNFEIINEQQLDDLTVAKRSNCILNSQKLANAGFEMTPSEDALAECMKTYVQKI